MQKQNKKSAAALVCAAIMLAGCAGPENKITSSSFIAMDTYISATLYGDKGKEAAGKIKEEILRLERLFSVTDEKSDLWRINHTAGGNARVSPDTAEIIGKTLEICEKSGGALDITLYPVVAEWGFTGNEYKIPGEDILKSLLENTDYRRVKVAGDTVSVPEGFQIDLGASAKGYAGDKVIGIMKAEGVSSAIVNLGGNVQTLGAKPDGSDWNIGIQDPFGEGYIGTLRVKDKAVVTSGGYERYFEENGKRYWHIIDPSDGYPADNGIVSATVIGDSGMFCDAMSTALFVMGTDRSQEYWRKHRDFEMILVGDDGTVTVSEGIYESFSPSEGVKVDLIK